MLAIPLTFVSNLFCFLGVTVHDPLRHQSKFGQNRSMPLHDMLQGMSLCFLKVVTSIQRVEPSIQEEFGPFSGSDEDGTTGESFGVLRDDQVDCVWREVGECADDTVGRYDGLVFDQEGLEGGWVEKLGVEGLVG